MSYELVITEKPQASKKIADALADGKAIKESVNGVPYYKITHKSKDIIVGCAVGHLYGLVEKEKKGWTYPVFDIKWEAVSKTSEGAKFTSKYLNVLKKLAKDAKSFTIACDYDVEGEVIGLNVVRFACKQKDARRMKFSTLTKDELVRAYEHASPTLDWGQAYAGETRHYLDYYWGINLSRALTLAVKTTGSFKILSIGRVQGPALKIIVDKEKEIKAFKKEPYWQIELNGILNNGEITALHEHDKFFEKQKAEKVLKNTKGKKAVVDDVDKNQFKQSPPNPFDLTTLQTEAYRSLKISPKETLAAAQNLYLAGLISYPRTSSQQLPKEIGYRKILERIREQIYYKELAEKLLRKSELVPNNGKKTDPAHPAIYPTGQIQKIDGREARIYDLILRRFLATFADDALRETVQIKIDVNKEMFIAKGTRTVQKGWHEFYGHHVKIEEEELPKANKGDEVKVTKISMLEKETQPPPRYTPASIIRELEKRNLGTKATRAEVVETLFHRGYVDGKSIEATDLGIHLIEILERDCPKILDEKLTRQFEDEMEEIREKTKNEEQVLEKAKDVLIDILKEFKKKEKEVGKSLLEATRETNEKASFVGKCPVCKEGDLQMRRGKFGSFVACSKYPDCKTTFSLPSNALIKPSEKICPTCGYPMVIAIKKGKRPMEFCLNPKCKSKYAEGEAGEMAKAIAKGEIEKECPKCKEGKLVLRSSIYGKFYGCSKYPKCRYTEKLQGN